MKRAHVGRCTAALRILGGVSHLQGMGEGEGKKDVSDQIQDEDQLLGAQQKDQPPPESKVRRTPAEGSLLPMNPSNSMHF